MRWLHVAVGVGGVIAFLATGQYMDRVHDHLRGMDDARRLLFRSTHLYLLFTSLVNLVLGLHLRTAAGWSRWVQGAGSLLLLTAPFLTAVGFFTEPWLTGLRRPFSTPATYCCLAGVLVHAAGRLAQRAFPARPARDVLYIRPAPLGGDDR